MSTIETTITPAQDAAEATETQSLRSHSLAYLEDAEHGIRVPVTEIALEPSPGNRPNAPLRVYRTAGPGSEEGKSRQIARQQRVLNQEVQHRDEAADNAVRLQRRAGV